LDQSIAEYSRGVDHAVDRAVFGQGFCHDPRMPSLVGNFAGVDFHFTAGGLYALERFDEALVCSGQGTRSQA